MNSITHYNMNSITYNNFDTVCVIDDEFDHPIASKQLKQTIIYLKFGSKYNRKFTPGVIPDSVEYLYIGAYYEHAIEPDCLPRGLKQLYIGVQQLDLVPKQPTFEVYLHDGVTNELNWEFIKNLFGYYLLKNKYAQNEFGYLEYYGTNDNNYEQIDEANLDANIIYSSISKYGVSRLKDTFSVLKRFNDVDLLTKVEGTLILEKDIDCDDYFFALPLQWHKQINWDWEQYMKKNYCHAELDTNLESCLVYECKHTMERIINANVLDDNIFDSYQNILKNHEPINAKELIIGTIVSYFGIGDDFRLVLMENLLVENITDTDVILSNKGMSWSVAINNTVFLKLSSISSPFGENLSPDEKRSKFFSIIFDYLHMTRIPVITKNELSIFDIVLDDFEVNNCCKIFNKIFYNREYNYPTTDFRDRIPVLMAIRTGINKIKRIDTNTYRIGSVIKVSIFYGELNVVQVFPKQ